MNSFSCLRIGFQCSCRLIRPLSEIETYPWWRRFHPSWPRLPPQNRASEVRPATITGLMPELTLWIWGEVWTRLVTGRLWEDCTLAEIVFGVGTSHGPLLGTPPDMWYLRAEDDRKNPALEYRGRKYNWEEDCKSKKFNRIN